MVKSDILALLAYNLWANERILTACERLSTDEFSRKVAPNPGWDSLCGILVHALDSEYGWRCVLQAQVASDVLEEGDFANVLTLRTRWEAEHTAWLAYAAGLNDDLLNEKAGNTSTLKVWQVIVHIVNHGTQHRSEAAAILTGYGQSPGELDFDTFLMAHPDHGG